MFFDFFKRDSSAHKKRTTIEVIQQVNEFDIDLLFPNEKQSCHVLTEERCNKLLEAGCYDASM